MAWKPRKRPGPEGCRCARVAGVSGSGPGSKTSSDASPNVSATLVSRQGNVNGKRPYSVSACHGETVNRSWSVNPTRNRSCDAWTRETLSWNVADVYAAVWIPLDDLAVTSGGGATAKTSDRGHGSHPGHHARHPSLHPCAPRP